MTLRDLFRRKPQSPPLPPPTPMPPLILARAPAYQPVPVNAAEPLDAQIARMWLAYQRTTAAPTWSEFVAKLTATNIDLTEQIHRAQADLDFFQNAGVFKP